MGLAVLCSLALLRCAAQSPSGEQYLFHVPTLLAQFTMGWFFMTLTFGTGVVTGIMIPSLLVGAQWAAH